MVGGFKDFVVTRKAHANPRGDFIRDVRRDSEFPDLDSLDDLLDYLDRKNGWAAMDAARVVWSEYEKATRGSAVLGRM